MIRQKTGCRECKLLFRPLGNCFKCLNSGQANCLCVIQAVRDVSPKRHPDPIPPVRGQVWPQFAHLASPSVTCRFFPTWRHLCPAPKELQKCTSDLFWGANSCLASRNCTIFGQLTAQSGEA